MKKMYIPPLLNQDYHDSDPITMMHTIHAKTEIHDPIYGVYSKYRK